MDFSALDFQTITAEHDVSDFTCGHPDMNAYLREEALSAQLEGQATTTVVLDDSRVVAYFTLAADSLLVHKVDRRHRGQLEGNGVQVYPSMILHRLAISSKYQGQRDEDGMSFCTYLIGRIIQMIIDVSEQVAACRFLLISAYKERVAMYEHYDFVRNVSYPTGGCVSMRLDLLPIIQEIRNAKSKS